MTAIKRRPVPDRSPEPRLSQPLIESLSSSQVSPVLQTTAANAHGDYQLVAHGPRVADDDQTQGSDEARHGSGVSRNPDSDVRTESSQPTKRYHTARFWLWEIVAILVAVGLMAAKVGLLIRFEGQELPDWPLSINLSTLLALFSIIQRAALLLILAEIIGQAKWAWFTERSRPIYHVEEFNEASRSTLGALQLFLMGTLSQARVTVKSLILLSAGITVLSFTIGPFTQQAFSQTPCRRLVQPDAASVPIAHYVPGASADTYERTGAGAWELDPGMRGVFLNGLMNPDAEDTTVQAQCPTGDCDFPDYGTGITYSSIGICSRCLDSSGLIARPDDDAANVTLGDGTSVRLTSGSPRLNIRLSNLSYAEELFDQDFAADAARSIMNMSIMAITKAECDGSHECPRDWGRLWPGGYDVAAVSCTIYTCLESYHGSVSGGTLRERVVSRTKTFQTVREGGRPLDPFDIFVTGLQSPCVLDNGTWYTAENTSAARPVPGRKFTNITLDGRNTTAPEECLYKLLGGYYMPVKAALVDTLVGACSFSGRGGNMLSCADNWWLLPLYNNGSATSATLSRHVESLTTAITNQFRKTGLGASTTLDSGPLPARAFGGTYQRTSCTTVDWRWLLAPIILVAATAALLAWVMLRSRLRDTAQPVWKGSVLPLLFYGLRPDADALKTERPACDEPARALADLAELKAMSKSRTVRFENGSTGLEPAFYSGE